MKKDGLYIVKHIIVIITKSRLLLMVTGTLKQPVRNLKGRDSMYIHPLLFLLICAMCASLGSFATALFDYLFNHREK